LFAQRRAALSCVLSLPFCSPFSANCYIVGNPTKAYFPIGARSFSLVLVGKSVVSATETISYSAAVTNDTYFAGVVPLGPVTIVVKGVASRLLRSLSVCSQADVLVHIVHFRQALSR
jgi:uncharacterized membrane protein